MQPNPDTLKQYNCNNDKECLGVTGIISCRLGHCSNISELYQCYFNTSTNKNETVDSDKDNLKLNGYFHCINGRYALHGTDRLKSFAGVLRITGNRMTRYNRVRVIDFFFFFSCLPINWPILCDRYCNKITTIGVNVFLRYGDYVHTGDCQRVMAYNRANGPTAHGETLAEPKQIWTDENSTDGVFMASCTAVTNLHRVEPFM